MKYTKEIFDILSRGGFISQNSLIDKRSHYYDAIEDDFEAYQQYFAGIGLLLEAGNGYFYFSRTETKVDLQDKLQRLALWIDRVDFLKTFNSTFAPGFTFRKSNILEQFSADIELKEKVARLYTDVKTNEEKIDKLVGDLERIGFVELENELDGTYRVTSAFHYIEEFLDCITITDTDTDRP